MPKFLNFEEYYEIQLTIECKESNLPIFLRLQSSTGHYSYSSLLSFNSFKPDSSKAIKARSMMIDRRLLETSSVLAPELKTSKVAAIHLWITSRAPSKTIATCKYSSRILINCRLDVKVGVYTAG